MLTFGTFAQLNPSNMDIYDVLQEIYEEWLALFDFDTFHMGADEVGN